MVVLDFGGLKDGYGSDTTRTVHVGEPTDEERKVFEIVKRAQQAGFEAVRPGVACQEIDRAARKVITDAGYGEYFIHRVGHGIGLTTHEPPYMVEGEKHLIEPGMCFSIEPGIYLPEPLRRADRGHRRRHRGRRPAAQQHQSRDAHRVIGGTGSLPGAHDRRADEDAERDRPGCHQCVPRSSPCPPRGCRRRAR